MRRVVQKYYDDGDCGIACAAMVAGVDYNTAHSLAEKCELKKPDGSYFTSHADLIRLLKRLGVSCVRGRFRSLRETPTPSIVKVNPTRDGKYWHWVVLVSRGGRHVLLDPNPDRPGRIDMFRGYRGCGEYLHAASIKVRGRSRDG